MGNKELNNVCIGCLFRGDSLRNKIIFIFILLCITFIFLFNQINRDDKNEIKKVIETSNPSITKIAHVEILDNNKAVGFYESNLAGNEFFSDILLTKGVFGWRELGSTGGQTPKEYKIGWTFSNLSQRDFSKYTDLIFGKIYDTSISEIHILTQNKIEFNAKIIEYDKTEKLWFLITDGENVLGSTITALSKDGKIIQQFKI